MEDTLEKEKNVADAHEKVMRMVEREVKKNPAVAAGELYEKAKRINRGVGKLNLRQFHAQYPLQVKGRLGAAKPKRRATPPPRTRARPKDVDRSAIRNVLLKFAKDVAGAEGKGEVVDLIAGLDKYVDAVVKAASRS